MAAKPKTEVFLFRMDETERQMLDELTEQTGLNGAELLRQLLRREYASVIGAAPRVKPKRK
jgi:hypothetical protein